MAAGDLVVGEVQVEAGKISPIVKAIGEAEKNTTAEIRVYLSKRWLDRHPYHRAKTLFFKHGMDQTKHRNGTMLYVNLRCKKFAIFGDEGIHQKVGQSYWDLIAKNLALDLKSTHSENAIARAVFSVGEKLKEFFASDGTENPNELSDAVLED